MLLFVAAFAILTSTLVDLLRSATTSGVFVSLSKPATTTKHASTAINACIKVHPWC